MTDTNLALPPPCPVCAGGTTLKEIHRNKSPEGFMCFFRCGRCANLFPRFVEATLARAAGFLASRL
jgi:hypothetical protein